MTCVAVPPVGGGKDSRASGNKDVYEGAIIKIPK